LGVKRPGREADHSTPSSAEVKESVELYFHSPTTPSWRGTQLKYRDNFTFAFYRGINEFKKGYQPRIIIINDENSNLIDHQNVLNKWKNFFNQMLNLHWVRDVGQMDIHTAEPLIPEPRLAEVEIAIGKLKSYKSPGIVQIPAE
jgi:hypothetical protein